MTIASRMLDACVADGQASHYVPPPQVDQVRDELRRLARARDIHVRTAVLEDALVVVARVDAALWNDDTPTMRRKLGL